MHIIQLYGIIDVKLKNLFFIQVNCLRKLLFLFYSTIIFLFQRYLINSNNKVIIFNILCIVLDCSKICRKGECMDRLILGGAIGNCVHVAGYMLICS